jgi:biopolymer transport protein ExbD
VSGVPIRRDMTPMVDVAFLLLIFFMSTTQFRAPEVVAVKLPASTAEMRVPETNTIVVTLNREGRIFVSSESAKDIQEVAKDQVVEAMVAWRSQNPSSVIIVKADRTVSFGEMNKLMNQLAEAKAIRFNLMTDVKRETKAGEAPAATPAQGGGGHG